MLYWNDGVALTVLLVIALLALGQAASTVLEQHTKILIPTSILAGVFAFVLGPPALDLLPLQGAVLESGVYHGLPIVFIALSLQAPSPGVGGASVRSMAFGITTMVALQTAIGLAVLLGYEVLSGDILHPGFGLLLPLGYEQGPGQALAMGAAWEPGGLDAGRQIGLLLAASGYAWAILVGIPMVMMGRRRGWVTPRRAALPRAEASTATDEGSLFDILLAIGGIYLLTYALCWGASSRLEAAGAGDLGAMIWSLHYMIGALLAVFLRRPLRRFLSLQDRALSQVAGVTVDLATVGALGAIQVAAIWAHPTLLFSLIFAGGVATLVATVWLSRRAFADDRFEHCVLWFGMSTGTMPVGLALLRQLDPDLRSSAPSNAVLWSALCTIGVAPIAPGLHAFTVSGWSATQNGHVPVALALILAYLAALMLLWWKVGGLSLSSRPWRPPEATPVTAR